MTQKKFHFSISERKFLLRFLDVFLVLILLYLANKLLPFNYFNFSNSKSSTWILLLVFYVLLFGEIFEMYNLKVASDKYLTFRSTVVTVIFTTLFYVFTPLLSPELPANRIQIFYFFSAILVAITSNRLFYIWLIFSPRFFKNILIIARTDEVQKALDAVNINRSNRIVVYVSNEEIDNKKALKYIPIQLAHLPELVEKHLINEIVVSSDSLSIVGNSLNTQLIELLKNGLSIKSFERFLEGETQRISAKNLNQNFYNYFTFSHSHDNNLYLVFRRFVDILFSITGIFLMLAIIPLVFIGNLIANRGKLFYVQKRVGMKGKHFKIIKFRSMVSNAEAEGAIWAKPKDYRITPFGKLLRKTRIDEMPQFINVLIGDMSLIGPRPERPEFLEYLEKELPFYNLRHVVKPGLTGWAQVMHPYATKIEDQHKKLMFDLYYIKERKLLLDFKIIMKTISTILFFRGT